MNKIVHKFLFAGDEFMPKSDLRQAGSTYSACRPFEKHRQRVLKFRETSYLRHLYRNELGKASFIYHAT